jgi:hypothetical protein
MSESNHSQSIDDNESIKDSEYQSDSYYDSDEIKNTICISCTVDIELHSESDNYFTCSFCDDTICRSCYDENHYCCYEMRLEKYDWFSDDESIAPDDSIDQIIEPITDEPTIDMTITRINEPIKDIVLPAGLRKLTWECDYSIDELKLPPGMKKLILGGDFNYPIKNVRFPNSIEKIAFGDDFDHSIKSVRWPKSLRTLSVGFNFNRSLEKLPATLEKLLIYNLKRPLMNLPQSLKKITLYNPDEFEYRFIEESTIPPGCEIDYHTY